MDQVVPWVQGNVEEVGGCIVGGVVKTGAGAEVGAVIDMETKAQVQTCFKIKKRDYVKTDEIAWARNKLSSQSWFEDRKKIFDTHNLFWKSTLTLTYLFQTNLQET